MDHETSASAADIVPASVSGNRVKGRIVWVDVARGVAIVAMVIYHFAWDLQNFGYVTPPTIDVGGWKLFARIDASSFLFLVGLGLVLAHRPEIRWQPFWKRLAMIVAAAAAITLVTWFVTPQDFIYYGILHAIALESLIGLAFLGLPPLVTLVAAAAAFAAPWFLTSTAFDHAALWIVGLSQNERPSNDFVPLLPWLAPLLVGIAAARFAQSSGFLAWLKAHPPRDRFLSPGLALGGRHSLAIYLLHQPILFGLTFLASQVVPAAQPDPVAAYMTNCHVQCTGDRSEEFCQRFCGCTVDRLLGQKLFNGVVSGRIDVRTDERVSRIAGECTGYAGQSPVPGK